MKYFVISDIHAHYSSMIKALSKNGYDESNNLHHLLVLGDLFDRGPEVIKVLEYLYRLSEEKKATILLGNHDVFLQDFLDENYERTFFNIRYNGFGNTLEQLSGLSTTRDSLSDIHKIINNQFPFLKKWISSFLLFLEIEDYIFVHGGIDGGKLDWKTMSSKKEFTWGKEYDLPRVLGKTVVCGHTRVATLRHKAKDYELMFLHSPELFDILYLEGKIMIDRYVEVSKEINVLTLDLKALK